MTDDPRRLLLGHFFRLVQEICPPFFVMENVVGLTQGNAIEVLRSGIAKVSKDYNVSEPLLLDAARFGAATKRRRMFLIGFRKDTNLSFQESDIQLFETKRVTVRDAIADLLHLNIIDETKDLWKICSREPISSYAMRLRTNDCIVTGNLRTVHSTVVRNRFVSVPPGSVDPVGRHPRLAWDGLCPTLRAGTGADRGSFQSVRPIHPDEPRVITVREAARLQGFPDWHVFHETVWHSFRMIGNSVSPIMAEAIFRAVKRKFDARSCMTGLVQRLPAV